LQNTARTWSVEPGDMLRVSKHFELDRLVGWGGRVIGADEHGLWILVPPYTLQTDLTTGEVGYVGHLAAVGVVEPGRRWVAWFGYSSAKVDLCSPLEPHPGLVHFRDLALDVVWSYGEDPRIVDWDEFEELELSDDVASATIETAERLAELVRTGAEPFRSEGQRRLLESAPSPGLDPLASNCWIFVAGTAIIDFLVERFGAALVDPRWAVQQEGGGVLISAGAGDVGHGLAWSTLAEGDEIELVWLSEEAKASAIPELLTRSVGHIRAAIADPIWPASRRAAALTVSRT